VLALPRLERSKMLTKVKAGGKRRFNILCIENKARIWGQSRQPPKANGGLGADPPSPWRFYSSFPKYTHFLGIQ